VSDRELHLEQLLGRRVRAANGRSIGRLEEVRAERRPGGWVVTEYLIGPAALFERLSAQLLPFLRARRGLVARWDQLDLSDPEHPRLHCAVQDLQRYTRH